MNKHILEKVALVTGGILIGSGVTYLIVNKRLDLKYGDMCQTQVDEVRDYYKMMRKEFPYDVPQAALDEPVIFNELATGENETVGKMLEAEGYSQPEVDLTAITINETVEEFTEKKISDVLRRAQENMESRTSVAVPMQATKVLTLEDVTTSPSDIPEMVTKSIFDMKAPTPEELGKEINKSFPYIISIEEWSFTEQQYDKTTLTYYQGSKQLADENDGLLPNVDFVIGSDAVTRFGHDPDNPQTVFVRNDKLKTDFEVILDVRTYNEAVLGIVPED